MASHIKKREFSFIAINKKTAIIVLAVAVAVASIAATVWGIARARAKATAEPRLVAITKIYKDGTESRQEYEQGTVFTLEELGTEGNEFFAGWQCSNGELLPPTELTADSDEIFVASYSTGLETLSHPPYLFAEEDGLFHFERELSCTDARLMIESLMPEDAEFSCELENGSEPVTRDALYQALQRYFPKWKKETILSELINSSDSITRGETAVLMNKILGRTGDSIDEKFAGGLLEFTPNEDMYSALCEACIIHSFSIDNGKERWTSGEALEYHNPGRLVLGTTMYWVDEAGYFVKNAEVNGFMFDEAGAYTSGDRELDQLVQGILTELYSPEYTDKEQLRVIYDYVVDTAQYLRRDFYEKGTSDYAVEAAKIMLSTWKGNCYNYAAAFCMLTRALGYDAKVYSGTVGKDRDPHGWCDITFDGVPYIFDTELQMKVPKQSFFMLTYTQLRRWNYSFRPKKD